MAQLNTARDIKDNFEISITSSIYAKYPIETMLLFNNYSPKAK